VRDLADFEPTTLMRSNAPVAALEHLASTFFLPTRFASASLAM
jgi:hypothetical protein